MPRKARSLASREEGDVVRNLKSTTQIIGKTAEAENRLPRSSSTCALNGTSVDGMYVCVYVCMWGDTTKLDPSESGIDHDACRSASGVLVDWY